jgi:hypothetical protein
MLSLADIPTYAEWVALLLEQPEQAQQLLTALRLRERKQGPMADPALIISMEDHGRAQRLLAAAAGDPQQAERVRELARLGQATLGPYPDRAGWAAMIAQDAGLARQVCGALQQKQAMLGIQAPHALQVSIQLYYSVLSTSEAV